MYNIQQSFEYMRFLTKVKRPTIQFETIMKKTLTRFRSILRSKLFCEMDVLKK